MCQVNPRPAHADSDSPAQGHPILGRWAPVKSDNPVGLTRLLCAALEFVEDFAAGSPDGSKGKRSERDSVLKGKKIECTKEIFGIRE
eukprot:3934894-Rhodomonas_salina.9